MKEHASRRAATLKFTLLLLTAAWTLFPLVTAGLGGFKTLGELRTHPFGLPEHWDPSIYAQIATSGQFWRYLFNSMVISLTATFFVVVMGSMAAFVFAHIRFFGRRFLFNYLIIGMTFPFATAILPLFITVRDLDILDSYWGVILPQVGFGMAFSVLLFRSFFEDMPDSLFEAAFLDGCGYVRFFFAFTLPLSTPILATVATFVLVQAWNNYLLPLVMLNSDQIYPWPLGIMQFRGQYGTEWNRVLAFVTLTITPAVIFFLAAQRFIVAGLTGGATKG